LAAERSGEEVVVWWIWRGTGGGRGRSMHRTREDGDLMSAGLMGLGAV
jgi:hypothetical protein